MDLWVFILLSVIVVIFVVFVVVRVVQVHRRRISAGREDLLGKTAEVKRALQPRGTVFVQGEHWTAVSEEGRVESGEEVTITRVDNLVLYVSRKQRR